MDTKALIGPKLRFQDTLKDNLKDLKILNTKGLIDNCNEDDS